MSDDISPSEKDMEEINDAVDDGDGCIEAWESMTELRGEQTKEEKSHHVNRRTALKRFSASALGVSGLATGIASADSSKPENSDATSLNTNFNPHNQEEVFKFARNLQELDRDAGIKVLKSLTEEQSRAVAEAMKPEEFEWEIKEFSNNSQNSLQTQQISASSGRTVMVEVTARNKVSGILAYTFTHTMSWQYNGNQVLSIQADGGPTETGLPWKYVSDRKDVVNNYGNSAVSYQTGEFAMCIYVPTCVVVDRRFPYVNLRAKPDGSYNVISKSDDNR